HYNTQERHAFGRCGCATCPGAGQDCQLPDPGIADACARRSTSHAGVAAVSSSRVGRASGLGWSELPAEYRTARTKPQMALAEIDRAIAAGVCFSCVLLAGGTSNNTRFRRFLP